MTSPLATPEFRGVKLHIFGCSPIFGQGTEKVHLKSK